MQFLDLPDEIQACIFKYITNPAAFYVSKLFNHLMNENSPYKNYLDHPARQLYTGDQLEDNIHDGCLKTKFQYKEITLKLNLRYWKDEDENLEMSRSLKIDSEIPYEKALIDCEIYLFMEHELMPYHFNYKKECILEKREGTVSTFTKFIDTIGYIDDFDFDLKKVIIKYNKIVLLTKEMVTEFEHFYD